MARGQADDEEDQPAGAKEKPAPSGKESLGNQIRTVLEVLKVFRTYSSCTYLEGGALVTHGETVIQDLDK
ncbi:MAG: hypothetical protein JO112_03115 [Planctomycetes bacterium]|nr:hypothetical protein [Planctomycetota bacterium]